MPDIRHHHLHTSCIERSSEVIRVCDGAHLMAATRWPRLSPSTEWELEGRAALICLCRPVVARFLGRCRPNLYAPTLSLVSSMLAHPASPALAPAPRRPEFKRVCEIQVDASAGWELARIRVGHQQPLRVHAADTLSLRSLLAPSRECAAAAQTHDGQVITQTFMAVRGAARMGVCVCPLPLRSPYATSRTI